VFVDVSDFELLVVPAVILSISLLTDISGISYHIPSSEATIKTVAVTFGPVEPRPSRTPACRRD
jgi:hypothetical protein